MVTKEKLSEAVKQKYGGRSRYRLDDLVFSEPRPFIGGLIYQVRFSRSDDTQKSVYVVTSQDEKTLHAVDSIEDLISYVTTVQRQFRSRSFPRFDGIETTAAVIAIMLTATIIFIVLFDLNANKSPIDIPALLGNSLTTVIGFYFGRAGARHAPKAAE